MTNLFSLKEAAAIWKVGTSTVYEHMRQGNIHSLRFGRMHKFTQEEISRVLSTNLPVLEPYKRKISSEVSKYLSEIGTKGGKATAGISTPRKRRAARLNIRKALDAKKNIREFVDKQL